MNPSLFVNPLSYFWLAFKDLNTEMIPIFNKFQFLKIIENKIKKFLMRGKYMIRIKKALFLVSKRRLDTIIHTYTCFL